MAIASSNKLKQFLLLLIIHLLLIIVMVNSERTRRHRARTNDDIYVGQLHEERQQQQQQAMHHHHTSDQDSSSICPNCLHSAPQIDQVRETDNLRLEAIKRQILSKLGMRHKPNITHSLPRDVIMETLDRADNSDFTSSSAASATSSNSVHSSSSSSSSSIKNNLNSSQVHYYSTANNHQPRDNDDEQGGGGDSSASEAAASMDFDDFYGRTSEIISFAEQGYRINQNRLLEFRVTPESNQIGQEFRVRTATLWLKADKRHRPPVDCRSEIYVFKIISRLTDSIILNSQDFNRITSDPIALTLHNTSTGWQKLDLTLTVQKWLNENSRDKLQLLVDCSCCSHWRIHLFNNNNEIVSSTRPFLQIRTDPTTAKRVRRRALDCSPDSGNQCCKQRFYVSFKQLGWDDWVIAPQGYYANYCRGDCGHHRTPDTYVTYHTHVIEEVRKTHHLSGMQPCCAPLKFSSMSLIYYGPDLTIIKRDLPKMVVDECGCP